MYICANCGHAEAEHFNGWGDCFADGCICPCYEPVKVEEYDPLEIEIALLTNKEIGV